MVARGIVPMIIAQPLLQTPNAAIQHGLEYAKSLKICLPGETVVVVGANMETGTENYSPWVQFHAVK